MVVRGRLALRAAGFNSRAPRKPFKQKSRAALLGAFHRANAQQRHPQPTARHTNPPTEIQGDVVGAFPPRKCTITSPSITRAPREPFNKKRGRKRPTTSPSTNRGPHEPTDRNPGRRCWGIPTAQVPNNVTLNQPRAMRTLQQETTAQKPNNVTLNQPRATRTLQQETRAQKPNNVKPESAPQAQAPGLNARVGM